jgi:hypothetical protein
MAGGLVSEPIAAPGSQLRSRTACRLGDLRCYSRQPVPIGRHRFWYVGTPDKDDPHR